MSLKERLAMRLGDKALPKTSVVQDMTEAEKEALAKGVLKRKASPEQALRENVNLL